MVLDKIQEAMHEMYGSYIYDSEQTDHWVEYIYYHWPGDYIVNCWLDENGKIMYDFEFKSFEDQTWFVLKYL